MIFRAVRSLECFGDFSDVTCYFIACVAEYDSVEHVGALSTYARAHGTLYTGWDHRWVEGDASVDLF